MHKPQNTCEKNMMYLAEALTHGLKTLSADSLRYLSKTLAQCLNAVNCELEKRKAGY